ncbi:lachesin-like isoform X2 [Daphnia pulicaria]|uniref:lachesin-like isoform X2 n=1 Tax=Daphnia pulicaria TaxID=35523 RepID=UPI001EEBF174|nr:lachesin-like isoform X2 [Daphnia pulicaria]
MKNRSVSSVTFIQRRIQRFSIDNFPRFTPTRNSPICMMLDSRRNSLMSWRSSERMAPTILDLHIRHLWVIFLMAVSGTGEALASRHPRSSAKTVMLADGSATSLAVTNAAPQFSESIRNVTVPLGREAVLSCVINNLAEYKVGWLRADDQTILSLHRRVVTHNPRVSVTHDESRTWNLHIRQVKESDQGCYMCQINTAIMKKQLGCIQVQVPPDIIDDRSTSDVTVNEGDNVTLTCTATGKPAPRIVWRREDGQKIVVYRPTATASAPGSNHNNLHGTKSSSSNGGVLNATTTSTTSDVVAVTATGTHHPHQHHQGIASTTTRERSKVEAYHGETLRLYRVTRQMMAAYMCIASNDVPPAVSKRVPLNVNFPPLVTSSMNVVGALLGTDVRLTCNVESHPPSINYWMKGRQQDQHNTILPSAKYSIDGERGGSTSYKTSMSLTIHNFQSQDKSAYICVAANSLGTAEASIQIYEVVRATSAPTSASRLATSTGNNIEHFPVKEDNEDDETSSSSMSVPPSEQQRERKQEQRDETANQIRGGGVSSGSTSSLLKFTWSFIHHCTIVFPYILTAMVSSCGKII